MLSHLYFKAGHSPAAAAAKSLVVSGSVQPHRQQPTRLPRPWDSPGKNTGVGCHFLLQCTKVKSESEVVSASSRPHGLQPTRLLRPCDFPGKSTGVGCHCLLGGRANIFINICPFHKNMNYFWSSLVAAAAATKSLQSCLTLCDPIDSSPPGSPVSGILQARTLEWGAISFSSAWKWSCSVVSNSSRPHGLQPTRLLHPWDFQAEKFYKALMGL